MPAELVIFDLDGTLVSSLRDIGESVNECLELLGLPTHPVERYRYMVGEGVPMLCRRAIGQSHPHYLARLIELTRARYRTRPLQHTLPYPEIPGLVEKLAAARTPLAVLSNKPHDMTTTIVRAFWPGQTFFRVQGYDREARRKPDPAHALAICAAAGVAPAEAWLVGDTPTDIETARNAGMRCAAVTWGFRAREDLVAAGAGVIVDSTDELRGVLNGATGH